jgi:uncharacterized protein YndB with AHSA1/START domain
MEADRNAPVRESAAIVIDASPETVWDTLTDLASWPRWMPGVKSMHADETPRVGSTFKWKAGPGTIRSEIIESDRPRRVAWKGRTLGVVAVHVWKIDPQGGSTRVFTEESFSGPVARVLRRTMRNTLRKALDEGLPALKNEAERRERAT